MNIARGSFNSSSTVSSTSISFPAFLEMDRQQNNVCQQHTCTEFSLKRNRQMNRFWNDRVQEFDIKRHKLQKCLKNTLEYLKHALNRETMFKRPKRRFLLRFEKCQKCGIFIRVPPYGFWKIQKWHKKYAWSTNYFFEIITLKVSKIMPVTYIILKTCGSKWGKFKYAHMIFLITLIIFNWS